MLEYGSESLKQCCTASWHVLVILSGNEHAV